MATDSRPRRRRDSRYGEHSGPCRDCDEVVLFLHHETTGKVAPVDALPVPGGNIEVFRDRETRRLTGVYRVLTGDARAAADSTTVDEDAQPTLHLNHHVTCELRRRPPPQRRHPIDEPPPDAPVEDPPDDLLELYDPDALTDPNARSDGW